MSFVMCSKHQKTTYGPECVGCQMVKLQADLTTADAENKRLREELDEHATFVYNVAILATPTGELRNKLTELNILRLQVLRGMLPSIIQEVQP